MKNKWNFWRRSYGGADDSIIYSVQIEKIIQNKGDVTYETLVVDRGSNFSMQAADDTLDKLVLGFGSLEMPYNGLAGAG